MDGPGLCQAYYYKEERKRILLIPRREPMRCPNRSLLLFVAVVLAGDGRDQALIVELEALFQGRGQLPRHGILSSYDCHMRSKPASKSAIKSPMSSRPA